MSVRFITESGKTTFEMEKENPLISTLLSMYDLHEAPEVITLSGSVGEIIDEEYEAFLILERRMKGDISVPLLHLSKVSRIIRIFDTSLAYHIHIVADISASDSDRFVHYETVEKVLDVDQHTIRLFAMIDSMGKRGDLLHYIYNTSIVYGKSGHIGALYNACRLLRDSDQHPELVTWDDFLTFIPENEENSRLINSIKLLAGRGHKDDQLLHVMDVSQVIRKWNKEWKFVVFIYNRMLDLIPDDVDAIDFGLEEVIHRSWHWLTFHNGDNVASAIVSRVHYAAVRSMYTSSYGREGLGGSICYLDIPSGFIGRKGFERIADSLLRYYNAKGGHDAYSLVTLIKEYLVREE